jgi:hypothetical protein
MNAVFQRKPAEAPTSWKDAAAYAANGYAVIRVESSRVEAGAETPLNGGGYGSALYAPSVFDERYCDYGVGVLCQKLPNAGISDTWARSTWLSVLRVDIRTDRKLVKEIETKVIAPRSRWNEGVTTKYAPVRLSPDSSAVLMPFKLDSKHFESPHGKTHGFRLPKDGRWDADNTVSISTAYHMFLASPYEWRDGLDLRAVHITALPLMDCDTATAIITDVERLLDARGISA